METINKGLTNLEEPQNEHFEKIAKTLRQTLEEKKECVEAEFEKLRQKFKNMIHQLNGKLINETSNDSELSEIEERKGVGI